MSMLWRGGAAESYVMALLRHKASWEVMRPADVSVVEDRVEICERGGSAYHYRKKKPEGKGTPFIEASGKSLWPDAARGTAGTCRDNVCIGRKYSRMCERV